MQENRRLFVSEILQRASLLSVVLAVCCAYVLYIVVEKYLEYRVSSKPGKVLRFLMFMYRRQILHSVSVMAAYLPYRFQIDGL